MSRIEKLIEKLISDFDDLRNVIEHFKFRFRNKGTIHYVYSRKDIYDRINIQRDKNSSQAKFYQGKQVKKAM